MPGRTALGSIVLIYDLHGTAGKHHVSCFYARTFDCITVIVSSSQSRTCADAVADPIAGHQTFPSEFLGPQRHIVRRLTPTGASERVREAYLVASRLDMQLCLREWAK